MEAIRPASRPHEFDAATIGALAHLYRGEVYRSTIWRTRLDNTTNWAVVTLGIALSVTFPSQQASPLPLLLAGSLHRVLDVRGTALPLLQRLARAGSLDGEELLCAHAAGEGVGPDADWPQVLAGDYCEPRHHITLARAVGRRLRRNYIWILGIQTLAYYGKIAIHPVPVSSLSELVQRASLGPIPGELILLGGVVFIGGWISFAVVTLFLIAPNTEQGLVGSRWARPSCARLPAFAVV